MIQKLGLSPEHRRREVDFRSSTALFSYSKGLQNGALLQKEMAVLFFGKRVFGKRFGQARIISEQKPTGIIILL